MYLLPVSNSGDAGKLKASFERLEKPQKVHKEKGMYSIYARSKTLLVFMPSFLNRASPLLKRLREPNPLIC